TPSGEWKLGGFEVLSNPKGDLSVIYIMGGLMPDAMACAPPEEERGMVCPRRVSFSLLNPNAKLRMSPKNLLDIGMAESDREGHGFFVHNRLVKVCAGLDGFTLSSESDKASLLRYV
ncbi:hypothetical protein BDR03DRAFT_846714, partial [Suillus americanus]